MIIFNYTVNYIDIILVAILLLFVICGYFRGLFINIVNFIRWALGMFLCFFLSEKLSEAVYNSFVKPRAIAYINENIVTSTNLDEVFKNIQEFSNKIPEAFKGSIDFSKFSVSGDDLAKSILENYFEGLLMLLTKAAIFIAVFAVFFLITGLIVLVIKRRNKKRDKKSLIKKTDRFLGGILGLLKGAIAVFAVSAVLMLIINYYDDEAQMSAFIKQANASQLLKLIDEINPFNAITGGLM